MRLQELVDNLDSLDAKTAQLSQKVLTTISFVRMLLALDNMLLLMVPCRVRAQPDNASKMEPSCANCVPLDNTIIQIVIHVQIVLPVLIVVQWIQMPIVHHVQMA